jgi:hypothetical protein
MKKAFWLTIGFLLFILGMSALVLQIVGVKFAFLAWLDAPGPMFGFLAKVFMVVTGLVTVYLSATDWRSVD